MLGENERNDVEQRCAHCGRVCGNYAGGYGSIGGQQVCHPNEADRPDCYHLVSSRQEVLGSRAARDGGATLRAAAPVYRAVPLTEGPDLDLARAIQRATGGAA